MMTPEATCRGSWCLGSACGHCRRCVEEASDLIPRLLAQNKMLLNKLTDVAACVPQMADGHDVADAFKARAFDEVRRIVAR